MDVWKVTGVDTEELDTEEVDTEEVDTEEVDTEELVDSDEGYLFVSRRIPPERLRLVRQGIDVGSGFIADIGSGFSGELT